MDAIKLVKEAEDQALSIINSAKSEAKEILELAKKEAGDKYKLLYDEAKDEANKLILEKTKEGEDLSKPLLNSATEFEEKMKGVPDSELKNAVDMIVERIVSRKWQ